MNLKIKWLVVASCLVAWAARGEFVQPTQAELEAAAGNPSLVTAMLTDATAPQAAEVCKDVIVEIVKLDLEPEDRDARIADLVKYVFLGFPEDSGEDLSIALGRVVAASPTASMSPALVSAIQQAIIAVAGLDLGNSFGNAYNLAMQSVAGAPGGGKYVPPPPPPPPVALPVERRQGPPPGRPPRPPIPRPYEGQRFR